MIECAFFADIDHTTGTAKGYFMQADMSKRQVNDNARLKGPLLSNAQCMTFYYHIFGHGGTLNIYMADGDNIGLPLWTRAGSQGDVWRFGRIALTKSNVNVVFQGKKRHTSASLTRSFLYLPIQRSLRPILPVTCRSTMSSLHQARARRAV